MTATADTTLNVDFNNDGVIDQTIPAQRLESVKIFDDSDRDQTGTLVFTDNGAKIAVAWGEDPENSLRTNPVFRCGDHDPTVTPVPDR